MKTVVSVVICVAVLVLIGANVVGAQAPALSASLVSGAPSLDGVANDAAWASAQALIVPVAGGAIGNVDVTLKAVYTASDIYVLLQWPDATLSIDKKMWTFDGTDWAQTGNEDRFGILWNIDESIANFSSSGCMGTCHSDGMYTNSDSELGDMWHWKAARGNPVGYVDDKYLNNTAGDADGGRHGDGGASTYSDNADEDENKAPDFVWATNSPSTPVGVTAALASRFLLKAEETAYSANNPLTGAAWAAGDTVPGYRLGEPGGSRADVTTSGVWANGVWTVEVKRALDTGANATKDGVKVDQVFEAGKTYQFGLAIMDNTGSKHSFSSGPVALSLSFPSALPTTGRELVNPFLLLGGGIAILAVLGVGRAVAKSRR